MTEYKVVIAGVEYGHEAIRAANIKRPLFDALSIGNACEAELKVQLRPSGDIPQMAEIIVYVNEGSGWEQLGVFYVDQRSTTPNGIMTLIAYDAMLKADAVWEPGQSLVFPMAMPAAVDVIAALMGVAIDPRTVVSGAYTIDYPANDYTLRDILRYIATANGGNWVITPGGELLLIPLADGAPEETSNLVTEDGDTILFGGVAISV